eukprot:2060151-Prymnesium_polylepis.1
MLSCIEAPREKKWFDSALQHTKSDGLGTNSRGVKGGQPPESSPEARNILGNFFFLAKREHFLKDFGKRVPPPPKRRVDAATAAAIAAVHDPRALRTCRHLRRSCSRRFAGTRHTWLDKAAAARVAEAAAGGRSCSRCSRRR